MDDERRTIRFIDSDYQTLFTIPDGENITLAFSNGETVTRKCVYLDEYHTQVGGNVFHICEFAEIMERNGTNYAPEKPLALPEVCYSTLPSTGELICIKHEAAEYTIPPYSTTNLNENRQLANHLNQRRNVFPQQEAAMLGGAMFGWHTPAAQVSSYTMHGEPIIPMKHEQAHAESMERGDTEKEMESSFLDSPDDAFIIYQLKEGAETRDFRFESLESVKAMGLTVERANYEPVYTAPLAHQPHMEQAALLESLYRRFNVERPEDFTGHSLSISDVIALKQSGVVSCHYVDRLDFAELPSFLSDNPLKNAEMSMEDDYGMIDGIINNGKATALETKAPEELRPFLERLKAKPPKQQRKKAPTKGAEMER